MIETHIIPDGAAQLPAEARDDGILWSHLSGVTVSSSSPVKPRDVRRVVRSDRLVLRLDGKLGDHSSTTLSNIASAVASNISGVKQHPDGWTEVQP